MRRDDALKILAGNREAIRRFHVRSLAVFGSVARDEATETSDVDVLVEFEPDRPIGLFVFIRLIHFLREILGCRVDLTTAEGLHPEMREEILKEAIRAA